MKLAISSLLLTLCLLTSTATSNPVTTGNLLPNANDGVDWNSNSTDQINPGSSGTVTHGSTVNGFDITCPGQSNCGYKYSVGGDFEVTGTATVTADDIGLTTNSITQQMLDNGITLNSFIDVANCESTEGNCESKGGANDTHTTTIILNDSNGNVLSTVSQTRNEVTGFQGNCNGYPGSSSTGVTTACGQHTDTLIHNDVGANKFDWSWSGTDSNYTNQSRQGPNLLGAKVTMTYNSTEYNPIDDDAADAIEDIENNIPDIPEDIFEEPDFSIPEEIYTEVWDEVYIDDTFTIEEEFSVYEMPEEFEIIEEMPEMEMAEEMEEEFFEMVEDDMPEMMDMQEEPTEMEIAEEESIDMEPETEEDVMEMPSEEAEEMEVAKNEEPQEDEKPSESSEEALEKESGSEESVSETVEDEKESMAETDVADGGGIETKSIKVSKTIKIKNVDIGEIKVQVNPKDIFNEAVSLDSYEGKDFYKDDGLKYEVNDDFFEQASMIAYNKEIYSNITLVAYIQADPVAVYKQELEELAIQKAGIMLELKILRGN